MDLKALGQNIRRCRTEKQLSQEQLAGLVNLSSNYIGLIERGKKQPTLSVLIDILNALDASADLMLANDLNYVKTRKKEVMDEEFKSAMREDLNLAYKVIQELEKRTK